MKRRSFLRNAALLPLPLMLNQYRLSALTQPYLASAMEDNDRILVLLKLNGGNDGLNTLIPLDQYSGLSTARANILIPENRVLGIEDGIGLHPAMEGIRGIYDAGQVSVIQAVGYPNQNRSHFRSEDIWNTGSDAQTVKTTGWLGRHLDERYPGYPDNYPSTEEPSPFAIVMGSTVSETCQGNIANFSIAVNDIDDVGFLPSFTPGVDLDTPYGRELDWLQTTISQSNQYAGGIQDAATMGNTIADYPEGNIIASKLRSVARLISGGLKTRIYIIEQVGFDTHADQAQAGDTAVGDHANLLATLSDAVAAFQTDLTALGVSDRVLGMTYSEFGRQIVSNLSQGTDHGDAAPLFLFGDCVSGGVTGTNPVIDNSVMPGQGVTMQYDYRNIYGSVLIDWFGVDQSVVRNLLLEEFEYIPVLANCRTTPVGDPTAIHNVELTVSPNPFRDQFSLRFPSGNERIQISLFDAAGRQVRLITDRTFPAGDHQLDVETGRLPTGTYFVRMLLDGGAQRTVGLVKN
jgi:uncharacterized protein (DUF1501 family)